jgi:hypothetical protein
MPIPPLRHGRKVSAPFAPCWAPGPRERPKRAVHEGEVEATSGFEPLNRGFADPPLNHLGTSPRTRSHLGGFAGQGIRRNRTELAAPRGFEPRLTDSKSAVLPLDEGAEDLYLAGNRPHGQHEGKWSGRRDSNPRPSPWQGDALPTEPLPLVNHASQLFGAESQDRTGDTAIFSRVLYLLSYLGPVRRTGCPSARGNLPCGPEKLQGCEAWR